METARAAAEAAAAETRAAAEASAAEASASAEAAAAEAEEEVRQLVASHAASVEQAEGEVQSLLRRVEEERRRSWSEAPSALLATTRKRIVNTSVVVLSLAFVSYIVFNFVILTELGVALDLPWESSRLWN